MLDVDPIAVAAIGRSPNHDTVGCGVNGRSGGRREINSIVHEQQLTFAPRRGQVRAGLRRQTDRNTPGRSDICLRAFGADNRRDGPLRSPHARWLVERVGAHAKTGRNVHDVQRKAHRRLAGPLDGTRAKTEVITRITR